MEAKDLIRATTLTQATPAMAAITATPAAAAVVMPAAAVAIGGEVAAVDFGWGREEISWRRGWRGATGNIANLRLK